MSDRAPAHRAGICETEIDGELVLLDTSNGAMHLLNPVAAAIWSELDGKRDVDEIVSNLSVAAGVERDRVRDDVVALLGELRACDLLASSAEHGPQQGEDRTRHESQDVHRPGGG